LDEKEIRTSIKSKAKRKLSKFKILNKGEDQNLISSIPPLEQKQSRKLSSFKKTYTKDQKSFEESPGMNKSQSMRLPPSPKRKMTISVNKEIIVEVSKENSPKERSNMPTSLGEFQIDELDSNNMMLMNKMTDLLSHNNLAISPQITPYKKNLKMRESLEEVDFPNVEQEVTKQGPAKMIYMNYPTESDLLARDEIDMEIDQGAYSDMIQFSRTKDDSSPPETDTVSNKIDQMNFKKNKKLQDSDDMNKKTNSNHISLKNSLKNPLYEHKHSFSQRNIVKSKNLEEESDLKIEETEDCESEKKAEDKILTITHNNGVKKITFSSEKHSKLKENLKQVKPSKFAKKNEPQQETPNSGTRGRSESIIKSFRSISLPKKKRNLNKNRFRCSVPLKMRSRSTKSMFQSFRRFSGDKAKLDREFMQNWISSGIKHAVVNLNKKMSLPNYLNYGNPNSPKKLENSQLAMMKVLQNKRNSHVEYAYGRGSDVHVNRASIKSLRNTRLMQSEKGSTLDSKMSLRDNFKFFDVKNSNYYKIKLNPNQEYIDNMSYDDTQELEQRRRDSSQRKKKISVRKSSSRNLVNRNSKILKPKIEFKEDRENFSKRDNTENHFDQNKPKENNSKQESLNKNDIYQYEFTFERSEKFNKKLSSPLMMHLTNSSKNKSQLICPKHKELGTHVCVECPAQECLKCGECQDVDTHHHVSLRQLQNEEWLQNLSEHKSVDSFSLFERLEAEFRKIKERLLQGLQAMVVSYKKAILENSKEFLLKGMAFRAKRSQEDFFGDPQNPGTLKKLAKQVFNLGTLRNAPFIEDAKETTNALIKSAISFHKDLELLMHTYSVTSGVITPRIKDISKSFRRNLSEMVAKIDNENKSKKVRILEAKGMDKQGKEVGHKRELSVKKKIQILKKKNSRKKKPRPMSSVSDKRQTGVTHLSHKIGEIYGRKASRKKSQKRKKSKKAKRSEKSKGVHLQISNLEPKLVIGSLSKAHTQPGVNRKIKLYKGGKQTRNDSQDHSLRKTSKESDYYAMDAGKSITKNRKELQMEVSLSGGDRTSLSERSLSVQKKLNKKTRKPKKLKKPKKKKDGTKALQKFMKKTNKFISQNRLTNTSSSSYLNRKREPFGHTANNEYAFHKLSPLRTLRGSNQSRKLYRPTHYSGKKSMVTGRGSSRRKKKIQDSSKKGAQNNQQKMLNLIRLSSSFNQIPPESRETAVNRPSSIETRHKITTRNASSSRKKFKPKTYSKKQLPNPLAKLKLKKQRKGHSKSKKKEISMIYRSDTSPKREDPKIQNQNVGGFLNMSAKYLTKETKPQKFSTRNTNSKKPKKKEDKQGFQVVYSIPELNREISKLKKRNKELKHKTVILENQPLGFKIKNSLGVSAKQDKSDVASSFRKITSKARREYMGNFF
jgi:hypothetical protein